MAIKIVLLLLFPLAAILVPETAAAMPAAMRKPAAAAGGNMHKMFFRHRAFPPYLGGGPKGLIPGGGLGGGSSSSSSGVGAGAGSGGPGGAAGKFFRGIRAASEASRALNRVYNGGVAAAGDVKMGAAFPMP